MRARFWARSRAAWRCAASWGGSATALVFYAQWAWSSKGDLVSSPGLLDVAQSMSLGDFGAPRFGGLILLLRAAPLPVRWGVSAALLLGAGCMALTGFVSGQEALRAERASAGKKELEGKISEMRAETRAQAEAQEIEGCVRGALTEREGSETTARRPQRL
jgi:hypothetical protein